MNSVKAEILFKLENAEKENKSYRESLSKSAQITDYSFLVDKKDDIEIWTKAFQRAIDENEIVIIPERKEPYYIDNTIVVPSNRHIKAEGAVIRQSRGVKVLLLRNLSTADGTKMPINTQKKDCNISISGGRWEESRNTRGGYGTSGMYDENRSFYGVSTCMLFNNMENLNISNVTFAHTGGFAIQTGNIKNAVFENILFEECYADGVHINGNSENIIVRNISGKVGDDLVALNMYDWQNSSVTFGALKTVLCENLRPDTGESYKSLRILPGIYYYQDGTDVMCSADDIIIRDVKGIDAFKLYFQTPPYKIEEQREKGNTGSGNNLFFENIDIDLCNPVDSLQEYETSDSVRGNFGAFEIGANIENIVFENIRITLYKDKYPLSHFICCGPKSAIINGNEVFDPYVNSSVENIFFKDIYINGAKVENVQDYINTVEFNNVNKDNNSSGKGNIKNICKLS